jgi:hypothetical protein
MKSPSQDKALEIAKEYLEHNKKLGITTVPQTYLRKRLSLTRQRIQQLQTTLARKKKIRASGRGVTHWSILDDTTGGN